MGNCGSSCCKGTGFGWSDSFQATNLLPGRSKEGPYESALADNEREAVADLLQYLENVRVTDLWTMAWFNVRIASRNRLLQRRPTEVVEHFGLFRECGAPKKCQLDLCRDHRTRYRSCSPRFYRNSSHRPMLRLSIDVREVDRDTLEPILFLLQSPDIEVQRAASAALGNLAVNSMDSCPLFESLL